MYGTSAEPGTKFAYHQLVCGDWWYEDSTSPTYNTCGTTRLGIFLHANIGTPTQRWVSLPLADLDAVLDWLNPALHPVIVVGPTRSSVPSEQRPQLISAADSPAASTTRSSTASSWARPGNITS